jgi:hypothetical protein
MAASTLEEAERRVDVIFEVLSALRADSDQDFFEKFPSRSAVPLVKYRARLLGDPGVVAAAGEFEQAYDRFLKILGPIGTAFSGLQPFELHESDTMAFLAAYDALRAAVDDYIDPDARGIQHRPLWRRLLHMRPKERPAA